MIAALVLSSVAWAAPPELVVVGVHAPGLAGQPAEDAARRIAEALDATGKVDALAPDEVRGRIAGREALILDAFALGPGRDSLREGKFLYDRAQPDQAIPVLEQASRQLAAGLATSTDTRDLHESLILLGLANAGLGHEAAARAAFRRSVTLNPSRQLDTVHYPPQIVALYTEVRGQAVKENPATISVTAPAGSSMWIDGRQTPPGDLSVVPGEHYLLLRAPDGSSAFETVNVGPAERKVVAPQLSPRAVGRPAADAAGRTRQTRDLYRSIGQYTDRDPVLLAGVTADGQVALQVYAPASGNFSRALTGEAGSDPVSALVDLLPAAVAFLSESGDIRTDRVSPQVVPFDVASNDVLAEMLFEPRAPAAATVAAEGPSAKKGVPWYVWAGIGAVAAGGGATAAVLLTQDGLGDNGTITFGPIP